MKKLLSIGCVVVALGAFLTGQALAGDNNKGNGFPPGFHYTLNIHAKNESFICDYERDELGNIIYGNVVNVPDYQAGEYSDIRMVSGRGKTAETFTTLAVTDPCAGFPEGRDLTGNDYASLQLPKNEFGYDVYARPLGKPSQNDLTRNITIIPGLYSVEMEIYDADGNLILDEFGNPVTDDLLYLGLVTDNGFQTPDQSFERAKGKSTAVPITGLFLWSGGVCYFDPTGYCDESCQSKPVCCETITEVINDVEVTRYVNCVDAVITDGTAACTNTTLTPIYVYCREYENYWVFNIADLVAYLWNVDSNVKQFNVRFYPRTE